MLRSRVYTLMLVMLLAGCSLLPEAQPTPALSPLPKAQPTPGLSPLPTRALSPLPTRAISLLATPGLSAEADIALRAAIADLTAKRKVTADKVQVVSVEAVDWPDTSLGCPQPGMFYAQVIVQGFKIVLSADGQQVVYHTDRQGHVGTCPK